MTTQKKNSLLVMSAVAFMLLFSSCATTAPSAKFADAIDPEERIDSDDHFSVTVERSSGVSLASYDIERLSIRIKEKIDAERGLNGVLNDSRDISIKVILQQLAWDHI